MEKEFKLERSLIFLDIEATGLDQQRDKIVEICLIRLNPDASEDNFLERVNPGIAIPPESTAIHGITDADVKDKPHFSDFARRVFEFLGDADLSGYNIIRFDVPMLVHEMERSGLRLDLQGRRVIDTMKIFHRKEPRDLAAAYKFYCGKIHAHAHDALADTQAAKEIFFGELKRYGDLPRDLDALHAFCRQQDERFVDSEGKFSWRYGTAYFNFGKYKGRSLKEVAMIDRDYLWWLSDKSDASLELIEICRTALDGQFPQKG
ncbi:MAG: 3'-5' exonuclease [Elusimicrobia bacterium]|nr:3'-5' exonuclease [Elusimicrobiota bacterium]